LKKDRLYWPKALNALDRLTSLEDLAIRLSSRALREEWTGATDRTSRTRAYRIGYRVGADGEGVEGHLTDIDLAYAWLYQDVAHGDEVSTGYFGVNERYRAAVGLFSQMAVVAIETLHYINHLVELGVIELPVGTFSDPVTVTDTEFVMEGRLYESEIEADLGDAETGGPLPDHFRPVFDLVHQLHEQRQQDEESAHHGEAHVRQCALPQDSEASCSAPRRGRHRSTQPPT
jgi:hypothetical protein